MPPPCPPAAAPSSAGQLTDTQATHSLSHSPTHSPITHSPTASLTHPFTHSLTQPIDLPSHVLHMGSGSQSQICRSMSVLQGLSRCRMVACGKGCLQHHTATLLLHQLLQRTFYWFCAQIFLVSAHLRKYCQLSWHHSLMLLLGILTPGSPLCTTNLMPCNAVCSSVFMNRVLDPLKGCCSHPWYPT